MPEIHVPFLRGIHEEVDPKMLPQGALLEAKNVRFSKDARVVGRNGYAWQTGAYEFPAVASANYEADRTLHFAGRTGYNNQAFWWQRRPDGTYADPVAASCLSTIEAPKRTVATPTIRYSAISSDIAYANGYLLVAYNDYDAINNTDGALGYAVYERQTMRLMVSGMIVDFGEAASAYFNPKAIALGDDILVFYMRDDEILMFKFDTTTLTGADVTLSTPITYPDPVPGHHASFDVCPYDADEVALAYEGVSATVSIGITVQRVNVSGTNTAFISAATYGTDPKEIAVAQIGPANTTFGVACITGGDVLWGSFNTAGSVVAAVSTLDSSGDAVGAPCMGTSSSVGNMLAWAREGSPAGQMGAWAQTGWGVSAPAEYIQSLWPASKPFESPEGGMLCWCLDETHTSGDFQDYPGSYGTYRLVDVGSVFSRDVGAGQVVSEAVCAQEEAPAANWFTGQSYDQRRHTVAISETADNGSDVESSVTALPTLVGAAITAGRVDFVEFRSGDFVDSLMSAKLNGQLFLSGPRMREFDGSQLYESGLFQGPKEVTLEFLGDPGSLPSGDLSYYFHWEWIDAGGRIHRSQVTGPFTVANDGGDSCTISIAPPPFSDRSAHESVTIYCRAFRTEVGKETPHLLNPNERIVVDPNLNTPLVYIDTQADADIADNEAPYTFIGDELDNFEPPPCKYIWAGEDRLIMGGLEDRSRYGFSKRVTPGRAVHFVSNDNTEFYGTIEGEVTGVAQLDGTWFVGSRDAIWAIVGDGPDDSAINGQFSRPRRLPSDTGFLSGRSIAEVPQGLLFQGRGNKMYLLPRGGGAPIWQKATQDTLATYPFITCVAVVPEEHVCIFACRNFGDGEEDADGRFLVFDTDRGEWTVDEPHNGQDESTRLFASAAVWNGKPLFDGSLGETDEWTDDPDGESAISIPCQLLTGDIRPFGPTGTGRVRRAGLLGESIGPFVNVGLEVTRDGGASYDSPAASWLGTTWDDVLEYDLPIVRDAAFRFRITFQAASEEGLADFHAGAAISALSLEVYPERGLKRLAASKRA